jgi:hypothetical protein
MSLAMAFGVPGAQPRRRLRSLLPVLALVVSLAAGARPAEAVTVTDVAAAAFDVTILRPLHVAALGLGSVFFVVSVPFVAPFHGADFQGVRSAWEVFVYAPYEYTFERKLGDF